MPLGKKYAMTPPTESFLYFHLSSHHERPSVLQIQLFQVSGNKEVLIADFIS